MVHAISTRLLLLSIFIILSINIRQDNKIIQTVSITDTYTYTAKKNYISLKTFIIFQVKVIENGEDFTKDLGMKPLEKKRFFMHAEDAALTLKEGV